MFDETAITIQVWSMGVIAVGEIEPINPNVDLLSANISGFAPFFEAIDLGLPNGNVFVHQTKDESVLTHITEAIKNRSQSFGFKADYVVTVTYQNVSSPRGPVRNISSFKILTKHYN